MTKSIKMQIMWACVILIAVLMLGYLGIFALQKSMTVKMGFTIQPNVRCDIWMHTNADETVDSYSRIFCNVSGDEYIASNVTLNEATGTLTLPNNFRGGIGAGFDLKIFNYTANTPILVLSEGQGISSHSVVCAGYVSGTPTPQILSINSATNIANIIFETEFYEVSFNENSLSFDNANTNVFEFNNHYYIRGSQQLIGGVLTTASGNLIIHSIEIGETTYNYSQVYPWVSNSNVLTIPNNIPIDGDITINGYIGAYTRLSYIQTSGTQYINTGVKLTSLAKVEIGLSLYQAQPSGIARALFGARDGGSLVDKSYALWTYNGTSGNTTFHYRYSATEQKDVHNLILSVGENHVMIKDGKDSFVDDNKISSNSITPFTTNYTAYLGTINSGEIPDSRMFVGNLLYCKIWANGTTPSRDYIPVLRTSDSKPGMLDLVDNVFHINQGTGADFSHA